MIIVSPVRHSPVDGSSDDGASLFTENYLSLQPQRRRVCRKSCRWLRLVHGPNHPPEVCLFTHTHNQAAVYYARSYLFRRSLFSAVACRLPASLPPPRLFWRCPRVGRRPPVSLTKLRYCHSSFCPKLLASSRCVCVTWQGTVLNNRCSWDIIYWEAYFIFDKIRLQQCDTIQCSNVEST